MRPGLELTAHDRLGSSLVRIGRIAFPGIAVYSATKSAVDRLTRVAAMESGKLGYGVRVNCVFPGLVPTEMGAQLAQDMAILGLWPSAEAAVGDVIGLTPLGRLGEVADITQEDGKYRCASTYCRTDLIVD